mgnify:FL=1
MLDSGQNLARGVLTLDLRAGSAALREIDDFFQCGTDGCRGTASMCWRLHLAGDNASEVLFLKLKRRALLGQEVIAFVVTCLHPGRSTVTQ